MSAGFRKSLFGFNCEEVIDYIEKAHNKFNKTQNELNKNINNLEKNLNEANLKNAQLSAENAKLTAELEIARAKYEEIERVSENIGKLYLVAQTNAKTIMDNAQNNRELSDIQVKKNIELVDNAQTSFDNLKENLIKTSYDFVSEVDSLLHSLEDSKKQLEDNDTSSKIAQENFESIFSEIVK